MALILMLCVLQLGSLARTSVVPLPPRTQDDSSRESFAGAFPTAQHPAIEERQGLTEVASSQVWRPCSSICRFFHTCFELLGDLRVYAGTTIICELLVLILFSAGAFTGSTGSDALEHLGGDELSAPLHFLLSQAALSLVLVRLYTAWLAHSLHKVREDMLNVVLPESAKARACEANRSAMERQRLARSVLVPAWEPPPETLTSTAGRAEVASVQTPWWHAWLHGTRARALFCAFSAFLLVITAAGVGLWRAHQDQVREAKSTCRSAARGLDFCVQKTYLGQFEVVKNFEQCCHTCDLKAGCQAWSFQAGAEANGGGRCWYMHFDEAPCSSMPSHQDCRCYTSPERIGGYRPRAGQVAIS